jgi:hypothetical protein
MDKLAAFTGETDLGRPEPRENSLYFSLLTGIRLETGSPKTASTAISSFELIFLREIDGNRLKSPQSPRFLIALVCGRSVGPTVAPLHFEFSLSPLLELRTFSIPIVGHFF